MRFTERKLVLLLLTLLLIFSLCMISTVKAEEEESTTVSEGETSNSPNTNNNNNYNEEEEEEDDDESTQNLLNRRPAGVARVIFPSSPMIISPTLPAGTKSEALIAYRNQQPGHLHTIVLIAGYLTPLNVYSQVIQNFSIVRQARPVQHEETMSFHYSFTPDAMLEPSDYNLILGLYYHDNITNNTYFATAFNSSVTVEESLGTDPKTILTYFTLLILITGAGYAIALKLGVIAFIKAKRNGSSTRRRVEVGTNGEGYDPDYVSKEHLLYREKVLQRNASASPTKKKKKN